MPALKAAASEKNPFGGKDAPRKKAGVHWLKPELVAEIEFAGFTGARMIRQAHSKDCVRTSPPERSKPRHRPPPTDRRRSTGTGKNGHPRETSSAAPGDGVVMGVPLSRPDKVLWPDEGEGAVTKLDFALFRGCRHMDDGAPPGPPLLDHGRPTVSRTTLLQRLSMKGGSNLLEEVSVSVDRKHNVRSPDTEIPRERSDPPFIECRWKKRCPPIPSGALMIEHGRPWRCPIIHVPTSSKYRARSSLVTSPSPSSGHRTLSGRLGSRPSRRHHWRPPMNVSRGWSF